MPVLDGTGLQWLITLIKRYIGTSWSLSPYLNSTSIVRTGTTGGRNSTNASNTYYFPLCVRIELK